MIELLAGLDDQPLVAIIGFLAIFPVVAWVYGLISWMIMDEVDVVFGVTGILVGLSLGYVAIAPPEPIYGPLALAGIVGMMIVFPIVKRHLDKRAMIQIEIMQIESAYRVLAMKPDHGPAKFRLAESLYTRGFVGPAVALAEAALEGMPKSVYPEEIVIVRRWKSHLNDSDASSSIPCLECGLVNEPGAVHCDRCGAPYLSAYARGKWLGPSLARKFVAAWVAAAVALVGLPVTLGTDLFGGVMAGIVGSLQVVLVGVLLVRAYRKTGAPK